MYTVALVEDDRNSRELIELSIAKGKGVKLVAVYPAAEEALQALPKTKPDVVLMDIKLPGMSGIDCVRALRNLTPPFKYPILILTEHAGSNLILDALKAGANGYLLKRHASPRGLQAAIREVIGGGAPFSPNVARIIVEYFHTTESQPVLGGRRIPEPLLHLSEREEEVLRLLTRGLMYKQIASALTISIDGVRKHLQSIYRKLQVRSRSEAMLHCLNRGHQGSPSPYTKM